MGQMASAKTFGFTSYMKPSIANERVMNISLHSKPSVYEEWGQGQLVDRHSLLRHSSWSRCRRSNPPTNPSYGGACVLHLEATGTITLTLLSGAGHCANQRGAHKKTLLNQVTSLPQRRCTKSMSFKYALDDQHPSIRISKLA